jgi:hypothetical protein
VLPKAILGKMKTKLGWIPWVEYDWHPAQKPYDIDVGLDDIPDIQVQSNLQINPTQQSIQPDSTTTQSTTSSTTTRR